LRGENEELRRENEELKKKVTALEITVAEQGAKIIEQGAEIVELKQVVIEQGAKIIEQEAKIVEQGAKINLLMGEKNSLSVRQLIINLERSVCLDVMTNSALKKRKIRTIKNLKKKNPDSTPDWITDDVLDMMLFLKDFGNELAHPMVIDAPVEELLADDDDDDEDKEIKKIIASKIIEYRAKKLN
jgi:hypothetical protein